MGAILPVILAVLGTGVGVALGIMLMPVPDPDAVANTGEDQSLDTVGAPEIKTEDPADVQDYEYARLSNQFVIPVVKENKVAALIVMSISLEMEPGTTTEVFSKEPKLRDALLQVLFDHSNVGGFEGPFTASGTMSTLRQALREAARKTIGPAVNDILVLDIVRQEFD